MSLIHYTRPRERRLRGNHAGKRPPGAPAIRSWLTAPDGGPITIDLLNDQFGRICEHLVSPAVGSPVHSAQTCGFLSLGWQTLNAPLAASHLSQAESSQAELRGNFRECSHIRLGFLRVPPPGVKSSSTILELPATSCFRT